MNIFKFDDYKDYILARIEASPQNGRGQFKAIATKLKMHPTLISRIFNGSREKDLTFEQAADLAAFLKLTELETDYFLVLVEWNRAGSTSLRNNILKRKQKLRRQAVEIYSSFESTHELSEADRAIYYSHWYYSAIHLLTDIPAYQNIDAICDHLNLPRATVAKVLDFLEAVNIVCSKDSHTSLSCGPTWVLEPAHSPYATRHHMNWRLKAMERVQDRQPNEKFLTLPVTISRQDREAVLQMIVDFVANVKKTVEPSPPEELCILNVDLFNAN